MLRQGERLYVRFDTASEARRAELVLAPLGPTAKSGDVAWLLEVAAARGSEVARTLAAAGLYPAELSVHRQTLEAVFIELTGDHEPPPGPAGPDAGTPAATAGGRS
jgi:hypothetical protein